MSSILVTGASRGLGFALVSHLLTVPVDQVSLVWAAARNIQHPALQELSQQHPKRLRIIYIDITDEESVANAVKQVSTDGPWEGLDLLVNNAAVMGQRLPITELDSLALKADLETNTIGCHRVSKAFLPLLRKSKKKTIVNLSAALASMGMEVEYPMSVVGTVAAYRISKTALNMLTRQWALALQHEGFEVVALHPGWVRTDMGGPLAPITAEMAADGLAQLILSLDGRNNGRFLKLLVAEEKGKVQQLSQELPW